MPHTVITAIYQNVDQHLHPGAEMKNSHIKKRMSQLFRFLLPCSQHLLRLLPTPKNNISFCFYVPLSFSTMTSPLTRCQYWRWLWINRTATQSCRSAFLCFLPEPSTAWGNSEFDTADLLLWGEKHVSCYHLHTGDKVPFNKTLKIIHVGW